jgi:hypothetical protein
MDNSFGRVLRIGCSLLSATSAVSDIYLRTQQTKGEIMILQIGKYKGQQFEAVPDDYLKWLAKPKYSAKFYKSLHSTDLTWKVPWAVRIEARKQLEIRGYKLNGETWERD